MITNLKPYSAYKDSGVEWLGQVPEHWEVVPLKRLAWFKSGAGFPVHHQGDASAEIPFFKVSDMNIPGNEKYLRVCANTVSTTVAQGLGATVFPAGTIVFPKVGGALLTNKRRIAANQCCIDNNMMACVARNGNREFLFLVMSYIDLGQFAQPGPVPAISEGEVREIRVALPSAAEQTAIVRFLDWAERRIRRVIRARKRRIKLLEEYKQALIHQAVTGKIDVRTGQPYPAYKPSGVEWLGDVPEHWEVVPIKRAFSSMDYGISESGSDSGTIRLLTMGHLKNGQVIIPDTGGVDTVDPNLLLSPGDLLFNRTNSAELVGKVALFSGYVSPVTFASYLVRMRPTKENEPEFLNLVLNDASTLSRARREAIPSLHQSNLNPTRYGRLCIALPPKAEQQAILQRLREQTENIDAVIAATRREIELLREYCTRLIADVVTGKVDVREVAAQLPEEPDEEDAPWMDDEERAQGETLNGEDDHATLSEEDE
ncbi:hypothetical protein GFC01_15630 [Desulfofundulus thermobenzoicus]|uniref:Type I restriction modification DNA specificity domain-containing protein n=1 Tax=Desulfofundulus thermobenzoicus TaxID=29376 RepID=A0A6N7IU97_9FIRM|nr:restriction endonuclease subunit S [Desulfofundulus thermobenzoicus]MQL53664.1 hypothetical protein [Desulfofundulus thermobenzoicus]